MLVATVGEYLAWSPIRQNYQFIFYVVQSQWFDLFPTHEFFFFQNLIEFNNNFISNTFLKLVDSILI